MLCYKDWLASDKKLSFSRRKSLSHARMLQLDMLTADLASKVMGLLTESPADLQHHTKVSLLLASARRRGRCQRAYRMLTYARVCSHMLKYAHVCSRMLPDAYRCEAGELKNMFHKDANLLRFVMAGACAPIFLHGAVKQHNAGNEVVKAGLCKWRTVTLTRHVC